MIIFCNSGHGEIWEKSLKKNFKKGIFNYGGGVLKYYLLCLRILFSDS